MTHTVKGNLWDAYIDTSNMRDTYNLDAASPRMINKKISHIICGEADES